VTLNKKISQAIATTGILVLMGIPPMVQPPAPAAVPGPTAATGCVPNALIVFAAQNMAQVHRTVGMIEDRGGCVVHVFPRHALIGFIAPDAAQQLAGADEIVGVYRGWVDEEALAIYGREAQQAAYVWNHNFVSPAPPPEPEPGVPAPRPLVGDAFSVETRWNQSPRAPDAPGYDQTSEFMAGDIAVGIILPESNGATDRSTENWSTTRMNNVVAEIQAAMNWWASVNPNGHLHFYYDIHYRVPTRYEPIRRSSDDEGLWISDTLSRLGYSGSNHFGQVYDYLNAIRTANDTDWAVAVFVVDSLNDSDGVFRDGYFGYAYVHGPFVVMTYDNDGWGIGQMDNVMAHEFGHTFGAGDEYCSPGYACCWGGGQLGYLGIPNSNCEAGCDHDENGVCDGDDSTPDSDCQGCSSCVEVECMMRNNVWSLDTLSQQQVGMRDSDGDGILDPVDTTPALTVDSWPPELITDNTPAYLGMAEDVPYDSPVRSDVTINHISSVQFEMDDGGVWHTASAGDGAFDETTESYTLTTPVLAEGDHSIYIRAINRVGNESAWFYDTFTVDTVPPTSTIDVLPVYGDAPFLDFEVQWSGEDATSGVAAFDVQYRDGAGGSWTGWVTDTSSTSARFVGEDNHTYYFRSRATDWAGNVGGYAATMPVSHSVQICPVDMDAWEGDDVSAAASSVTTNGTVQTHNFHVMGDDDWIEFSAITGVTYTLMTTNTGGHADTVLYLYGVDGSTLIDLNDDYPGRGYASRLDWRPAISGVYYAMVEHGDQYAYGCTTGYDLSIVSDDQAPPTSAVLALPAQSESPFMIHWSGNDLGTGIADYDIEYRDGFAGSWVTWLSNTSSTSGLFTGVKGHTYYFRSRARDRVGNLEPWPSDLNGDTFTQVPLRVFLPLVMRG